MVSARRGPAMDYVDLPSLMSIAAAVFLIERGQTDRQTDKTNATEHSIPRRLYSCRRGMMNRVDNVDLN